MPAHTHPRWRPAASRRRKEAMIPTTRATSTPSRRVTISASNMGLARRRGAGPALRRPAGGGAALRLGAALAEAVDLQRVGGGHEAVGAADLRLQGGDP